MASYIKCYKLIYKKKTVNINKNHIVIKNNQVTSELHSTWRNAKQVQLQLTG